MTNTGRTIDMGDAMNSIPGFRGFKSNFLRFLALIVLLILLFASTTSIPTGHVGVLTLFGRVTGDVLGAAAELAETAALVVAVALA